MQLANHFHKLDANSQQQKRVHHFDMNQSNWESLKESQLSNPITEIHICLGLDKNVPSNEFAFFPILEIHFSEQVTPRYFPLEPFEMPETPPIDQEIVPEVFKEMILANWNTLDTVLIDDLFIAQARDNHGNLLNQMVRVHKFIIDSEPTIEYVNGIFQNFTGLTLYPGVDLNKFTNKSYISFTPVLELKESSAPTTALGRMGEIEFASNSTYLEYSRPCPPTCHKPPRKHEHERRTI